MNITNFIKLIPLVRPEYQALAGHLVSILLICSILLAILKILHSKEMKSLFQTIREFGKAFLKEASIHLQLPRKYPCIDCFGGAIQIVVNYTMFLTFFALSMLTGVMAILSESISAPNKTLVLFIAGVILIFARFFFAEAERGRIAIPKLWENCRGKKENEN